MPGQQCFDYWLQEAGDTIEPKKASSSIGNRLAERARKGTILCDMDRLEGRDIAILPVGSWLLGIHFTLAKDYTSKAEGEFHPSSKDHEIHNPIVRGHITGRPMVRPTSWKGHLRSAARQIAIDETQLIRLFGNEPGEDDALRARLHFFPAFFEDEPARAVLTPVDRSKRTPVKHRAPINLEAMAPGRSANFYLLYLPHPKGEDWREVQVQEDFLAAVKGLRAMFLDYGFSAKKTCGWGIVSPDITTDSRLWCRGSDLIPAAKIGHERPQESSQLVTVFELKSLDKWPSATSDGDDSK